MSEWYLVYCKARQEDAAAKALEEQGYIVYLPKLKVRKRRASGVIHVEEPLFPRYLFVAVEGEEQSIGPVQYTRGVQNLVKFGTVILPIPERIVLDLKEEEDPDTGFHRLELPGLELGDAVHIRSGAFAGMEGIFQARSGKHRVVVLLSILGQQAPAALPIDELER